MNHKQSTRTAAACLIIAGSLGVVGISSCIEEQKAPEPRSSAERAAKPISWSTQDRSSIQESMVHSLVADIAPSSGEGGRATSQWSSAELHSAFRLDSRQFADNIMPSPEPQGWSTHFVNSPDIRAMIAAYIKQSGIEGTASLPENPTSADLQRIMQQVHAALTERDNASREASRARQAQFAMATLPRGQVVGFMTAPSAAYVSSLPSFLLSRTYAHSPARGQYVYVWDDSASFARSDALRMYDAQKSGSMGWAGYAGGIDD